MDIQPHVARPRHLWPSGVQPNAQTNQRVVGPGHVVQLPGELDGRAHGVWRALKSHEDLISESIHQAAVVFVGNSRRGPSELREQYRVLRPERFQEGRRTLDVAE